jgi:DNA (cytosine-5)-methyltransferase 1
VNVLDLFSGIGGFSLGLERAGMRTVAFCEIEPFCRAVLKKHWPHVPCYEDVRELTADRLATDGISIDVICGGFPCQDISQAGKGAGIEGERSGLWSEYARIIGEVRPRYVIVENVAALLGRGIERVLGDLAALGYDAEWHCIPAAAVGAPHRRDRFWAVAYPGCQRGTGRRESGDVASETGAIEVDGEQREWRRDAVDDSGPALADASRNLQPKQTASGTERKRARQSGQPIAVADANSGDGHGRRGPLQVGWGRRACEAQADDYTGRTQWLVEPDVGRVAHGVSARVDRLRGLGNAVVPQIPEIIGRAIMNSLSGEES